MREIVPGIFHWTAFHPAIHQDVSSYAVPAAGIVVDPLLGPEGVEALPAEPAQVVLTTGLHDRSAQAVADAFGIPIRVSEEAAERLGGALAVETFVAGEELAPGVTALKVGVLCPDEDALHIAVGDGALLVADGVLNTGQGLDFFSDDLLGDDPEAVKAGLKEAYRSLLAYDFAHLLPAHGEPLVGDGREQLQAFVGG